MSLWEIILAALIAPPILVVVFTIVYCGVGLLIDLMLQPKQIIEEFLENRRSK